MRFRYLGELLKDGTRDGHKRGGVVMPSTDGRRKFAFPVGQEIEVDDAELARRLSTNTHFEAVVDAPPEQATDDEPPKKKGRKAKDVKDVEDVDDAGSP